MLSYYIIYRIVFISSNINSSYIHQLLLQLNYLCEHQLQLDLNSNWFSNESSRNSSCRGSTSWCHTWLSWTTSLVDTSQHCPDTHLTEVTRATVLGAMARLTLATSSRRLLLVAVCLSVTEIQLQQQPSHSQPHISELQQIHSKSCIAHTRCSYTTVQGKLQCWCQPHNHLNNQATVYNHFRRCCYYFVLITRRPWTERKHQLHIPSILSCFASVRRPKQTYMSIWSLF